MTEPGDDRPLTIVFFTDTYRPAVNGVSTAIVLFSGQLRRLGHRVCIVGPRSDETADEPDFHGVRSVALPVAPDFRVGLPVLVRTAKRMPDFGADVVHGHSPGPIGLLGLSYAKAYRLPVVQTYHAMLIDYARLYVPRALVGSQRIVNWWQHYLYDRGDVITAPTPAIQRYLTQIGMQRPIVVLPTGIDTELFRSPDMTLADRFALPADRPIVATLSRLAREKNVGFLIKAMELLHDRRPDALLLVMGDGPYRAHLEAEVMERDLTEHVRFTGMVSRPEAAALLNRADVFAYACQTDTQGLVVMEAMASGLPLVLVDDRVFEPFVAGGNGVLLPADPLSFATQIGDLLDDAEERARWAARSSELARAYSIEKKARALADLYRDLARG